VSGAVGEKRARLEETTAEVVASVDSAVSRAKEQASSTATSAASLLGDVKKASEDMQAGASSSIDSFQRFLGDQGDSVSNGVTAHFTALGASLQAAKKGVSGISGVSDEYRSALLADPPVRSGSTPEKQTDFPALVDLGSLATREHGVIRQESLDGTWAASRAGTSQDGEEAHLSTESTRSVEDLMKVQDEQEHAAVAEASGEDASTSASMETEGQRESSALEDATDAALATKAAEEEKEEREMGSFHAHRTSSGSSTKNVVIDGGKEAVATENEENLVNAPPPAPAGASRGRASSRAGASGKAAKSGLRAPASRARSQSRTRL
jgi:hypothetical protein